MSDWCPKRPEESFGSLGIAVKDSEMLCGYCELDLGPLEELPHARLHDPLKIN